MRHWLAISGNFDLSNPCSSGVLIGPGHTTFTRRPSGVNSSAAESARPRAANYTDQLHYMSR